MKEDLDYEFSTSRATLIGGGGNITSEKNLIDHIYWCDTNTTKTYTFTKKTNAICYLALSGVWNMGWNVTSNISLTTIVSKDVYGVNSNTPNLSHKIRIYYGNFNVGDTITIAKTSTDDAYPITIDIIGI